MNLSTVRKMAWTFVGCAMIVLRFGMSLLLVLFLGLVFAIGYVAEIPRGVFVGLKNMLNRPSREEVIRAYTRGYAVGLNHGINPPHQSITLEYWDGCSWKSIFSIDKSPKTIQVDIIGEPVEKLWKEVDEILKQQGLDKGGK